MKFKSMSLLCVIVVFFSNCSHFKNASEIKNANDFVVISTCRLLEDSAGGEIWQESEKVTVSYDPRISEVIEILDRRKKCDNVAVPMFPYKDLIICYDNSDRNLFAIAQKLRGDCVRISSFKRLENGDIFIGGEKVFENLIYCNRIDLAENLRAMIQRQKSHERGQ